MEVEMKQCPYCDGALKHGKVRAEEAGSLTDFGTMLNWYSDEDKGKILKRNSVSLKLYAEGYYCEECEIVFTELERRC